MPQGRGGQAQALLPCWSTRYMRVRECAQGHSCNICHEFSPRLQQPHAQGHLHHIDHGPPRTLSEPLYDGNERGAPNCAFVHCRWRMWFGGQGQGQGEGDSRRLATPSLLSLSSTIWLRARAVLVCFKKDNEHIDVGTKDFW